MPCAPGEEEQSGLCYKPCASGYYGDGPTCWAQCPPGFTNLGVACNRPGYGRGAGHRTQDDCEHSDDHGAKTNGCEKWGDLWYPKCDPGYEHQDCCLCKGICPSNTTASVATCTKHSYDRGAGTIPSPSPSTDHALEVGGIILLVVLLLGVFVAIRALK